MLKNSLFLSFVLISFSVGLLIILRVFFNNYLSIIYLLTLFPFYIGKCLNLIFLSSSYIKKSHPVFYEKHKSFTNSLDGKIVYLDKKEILKLEDNVVENYYLKIKQYFYLIVLTFVLFIIFSIMIIIMK